MNHNLEAKQIQEYRSINISVSVKGNQYYSSQAKKILSMFPVTVHPKTDMRDAGFLFLILSIEK